MGLGLCRPYKVRMAAASSNALGGTAVRPAWLRQLKVIAVRPGAPPQIRLQLPVTVVSRVGAVMP